ncbi:Cationic amino acid transporter 9 [Citrus sinensis]|uniref:Cationic amino acid transporter 9 n=1 Tax=Citrus sinensis TaxID=2711 RepID=A0ACB8MSJ0_CITSI|nr:Cationic amino acid transporter 9 [Citrus sinensis]KAH9788603.1 Cationic amino acid transporter 9 [Citrus sinensis]
MGGENVQIEKSNNNSSSSSSPSASGPPPTCFSHFWSSALRAKTLTAPSVRTNDGEGLLRRLGLFELVLIGVGASVGAGIFVVTGTVARDAGPGVTISFLLAGAASVLNALCYAELASRFPAVVGGAYLYAYTAFNELTAFLVFAQLMLDYHIGAASIARSLASYVVSILELFPFFKENIPSWIGHGGEEFLGGTLSINILAPILLALLTIVLCWGVGESSVLNSCMTVVKVIIVIVVIFAGAFEVDVSNWSPFAPNGFKEILTGATVVFFAYVGFDAVANSAEESKKPQRDLPIGILGSLLICAALYVGVSLVLTGMVPYKFLDEDAPLSDAFASRGLKYVSVLISFGAVAGLTTTLLVGLYVQSRLYLGLGRDGLLPSIFAKVHPKRHTPVHSQVWVGIVAACVIALRWKDRTSRNDSSRLTSAWRQGVICLIIIACCGFGAGLFYRINASYILLIVAVVIAVLASAMLCLRHGYSDPPGFSCPGVPLLPAVSIFFNLFLFAQLHYEAWWRFVILSFISIGLYAFYGQYHADPSSDTIVYHRVAVAEAQ